MSETNILTTLKENVSTLSERVSTVTAGIEELVITLIGKRDAGLGGALCWDNLTDCGLAVGNNGSSQYGEWFFLLGSVAKTLDYYNNVNDALEALEDDKYYLVTTPASTPLEQVFSGGAQTAPLILLGGASYLSTETEDGVIRVRMDCSTDYGIWDAANTPLSPPVRQLWGYQWSTGLNRSVLLLNPTTSGSGNDPVVYDPDEVTETYKALSPDDSYTRCRWRIDNDDVRFQVYGTGIRRFASV